jgi:aminoglycoside phosphotransferase (APT) family kinase protein
MSVAAPAPVDRPAAPRTPSAALERALRSVVEGGGELELVERRPLSCHATFPLEELRLRDGDGRERWLVWKDLSRRSATDPVWAVKPRFVQDPLREVAAYRQVLFPAGVSAPRFLGASTDAATGRCWLFLERVAGRPLWQHGELEAWCAAARWAAELHARFAARPPISCGRLLAQDAGYFRRWIERLERSGRWLAATMREVEGLVRSSRAAVRWLAAQPVTLVHGELYPSNVLVEESDGALRIRPVDWEMAGIGAGLLDLAALTSGSWSEAERTTIVEAYRRALPERLRPLASDLRAGLDRCRLLLAVQWLTWSPFWTPPPDHAHDWLGEALGLASRLERPTPPSAHATPSGGLAS